MVKVEKEMLKKMDKSTLKNFKILMEKMYRFDMFKFSMSETVYFATMPLIDELFSDRYTPEVIFNIAETMYDAATYAQENNKLVNFREANETLHSFQPVPLRWEPSPLWPECWIAMGLDKQMKKALEKASYLKS